MDRRAFLATAAAALVSPYVPAAPKPRSISKDDIVKLTQDFTKHYQKGRYVDINMDTWMQFHCKTRRKNFVLS